MPLQLSDRILLELYQNPGTSAAELANTLGTSREVIHTALNGSLSAFICKDEDDQFRPSTFLNANIWTRQRLQCKSALLTATASHLKRVPCKLEADGPLDLKMTAPLNSKVRFYVFRIKMPGGKDQRAYINLTVGGSSESGLRTFDRSGGFRPLLVGYYPDDDIFALWDADIYEWSGGFKYNRFCSVALETLLEAIATSIALEQRSIRKPNVTETVVACRHDELVSALEERRDLTLNRILEAQD